MPGEECRGGCQCHDVSGICGTCCAPEAEPGLPDEFQLVIVHDQVKRALTGFFEVLGWELFPVSNGTDENGEPAFVSDDLPCFGVRVKEKAIGENNSGSLHHGTG